MKTLDIEDCWKEEDFEDMVASSLISCYESKVIKCKGAPPSDRLTDERVNLFKNIGPYIISNSRIFMNGDKTNNNKFQWRFDTLNDPLPEYGCIAFKPTGKIKEDNKDAYMSIFYIRKAPALGKYWHRRGTGTLYEMFTMSAKQQGGIYGDRRFLTVSKDGSVVSCTQMIQDTQGYHPGVHSRVITTDDIYLEQSEVWGSITLQGIADRRFCWTITASEKIAKAHLGCMKEEVKSLLYARSLPLTSTGRKRPILHLIEAHKRRLRNGTEIDIIPFLRGQQVIEIGGTTFKVNPPSFIKPTLSDNSKKKYYDLTV